MLTSTIYGVICVGADKWVWCGRVYTDYGVARNKHGASPSPKRYRLRQSYTLHERFPIRDNLRVPTDTRER